jgi:Fe2+ or Zn2+ uptake regulation protein
MVFLMPAKTWRPYPLHLAILEGLEKKGGSLTVAELHDFLVESFGDVGFRNLNKELLRLEIQGRVHVSTLTKGKRRVELIKQKDE